MKAVLLKDYGGVENLFIGETDEPQLGVNDLLVRVKASALNRADLLQRLGLYPPPEGASEVLGLEMAGEVIAIGSQVTEWIPGDRVCALLPGGGYAEMAVVPAEMAMRIPDHLSFEQGAAIPEVFLTAYLNLIWLGGLKTSDTVLIHAGASGVGTAAIQLVREFGAASIITAGSQEKMQRCLNLGASAAWNYKEGSFAPWAAKATNDQGVNIILDFIGAPYFEDNLSTLAKEGRLIVIGTLGGAKVKELNLNQILSRRLQIIGTALRSRSLDDKIKLTSEFSRFAMPRFANGRLEPIIDTVFDWKDVVRAHEYMETNANIGKIILKID